MKLILVRHAETEWNLEGIIQGHSDSPLTCRGLRETSVLLAAFSASEYQIERVYASPLGRAWQMGQSLAEHFHCSLTAEPALKEQASPLPPKIYAMVVTLLSSLLCDGIIS